jgi:hypothetical protein
MNRNNRGDMALMVAYAFEAMGVSCELHTLNTSPASLAVSFPNWLQMVVLGKEECTFLSLALSIEAQNQSRCSDSFSNCE